MPIEYGPRVVTDGLVLALDAADINSFDEYENLLTYSEQFNDASWGKVNATITSNVAVAPDGTTTADKLVEGTGNTYFYTSKSVSGGNQYYTHSLFAKQVESNRHLYFEVGNAGVGINLSTGQVFFAPYTFNTGWSNPTVTIVPYPNGWYRCSITALADNTITSVAAKIHPATLTGGSGGIVYTGDGASGIYIWGAQLERGSSANNYYPTTGTTKTRGSTWIDLTGNSNNGTLTNGPTYNISNSGSIVFDGVDDYVQGTISSSIFTGPHSISCWFYRETVTEWSALFSNNVSTTSCSIFTFISTTNTLGTNQAGVNGTSIAVDLGSDHLNKWIYAVITYAGVSNGSAVNVYAYKNGSLLTASGSLYWNMSSSSSYYIGRHWTSAVQVHDGFISQLSIYNKALTASEIQQNFNALRGRFGI